MVDESLAGEPRVSWWRRCLWVVEEGVAFVNRHIIIGFLTIVGVLLFLALWQITANFYPFIAEWLGVTRCQ